MDRRTLNKMFADIQPVQQDGRAKYYTLKQFVEAVRGKAGTGYEMERTRLTKAQAEHEELKVEAFKGQLLDAGDVAQRWGDMTLAFRAKMLALVPRLSSFAISATDLRDIEDFTREEIHAALNELENHDYEIVGSTDSGNAGKGQSTNTLDS